MLQGIDSAASGLRRHALPMQLSVSSDELLRIQRSQRGLLHQVLVWCKAHLLRRPLLALRLSGVALEGHQAEQGGGWKSADMVIRYTRREAGSRSEVSGTACLTRVAGRTPTLVPCGTGRISEAARCGKCSLIARPVTRRSDLPWLSRPGSLLSTVHHAGRWCQQAPKNPSWGRNNRGNARERTGFPIARPG